ncbi:MAG: hypothetical protein ACLP7J_21790 [Streptosporangiaceae bacterium]
MPGSFADKVRGLLASDVYTEKGRLRSDDLLVRERVGHGLAAAAARVRELISAWRADRVPPATREQPFPPAAVMEPIRAAERLVRAIEDAATTVRGLPLLNADKVWDRVRRAGLDELLQFDWTLVGEADALAADMTAAPALDQFSVPAQEARLAKIRSVIADRQRYIEIS